MRFGLVALAGAVLAWSPAVAQPASPLAGAIQSGQVGERFDGYMAALGSVPPQVKRQVDAVNIHRRKLYIELAQRRNVTAEVVGLATACQLFTQLATGEPYLLEDGVWRRRLAGHAPPIPDYCR
jgi:uncharacterized protein